MKEFFVTLLSNSSMNIFAENKTSSFTVHLPEKITLNGSWSVGVAEIHYNYNFFNVTTHNNALKIVKKISDNSENALKPSHKLQITPGYYNSVSDLIEAVNIQLKTNRYIANAYGITSNSFISLDKMSNRTVVNKEWIPEGLESISFEGRLALQLGFEPYKNVLNYEMSPHVGNTFFGIPDQMMIYTDIIEPTYIGHEKAYVLKIINTNGHAYKFGDMCYKEYTHIHYMPVQKREFEAISVDIRDYTGAFMPFQHGVLTIKLHFKKNGSE